MYVNANQRTTCVLLGTDNLEAFVSDAPDVHICRRNDETFRVFNFFDLLDCYCICHDNITQERIRRQRPDLNTGIIVPLSPFENIISLYFTNIRGSGKELMNVLCEGLLKSDNVTGKNLLKLHLYRQKVFLVDDILYY